jgi:hypothetical protein
MSPADVAVVLFFVVWLALCIASQFSTDRINALKRFDVLQILPIWTFFAPNPGRSDYHVIGRDRLRDGTVTSWRDVLPIPGQDALSPFWNPRKRRTKVVVDAVATLVDMVGRAKRDDRPTASLERTLLISGPYLVLVNIVAHAADHHPDAAAFQFAVVERQGFGREEPPTPLVMSPFHGLT